MFFRFGADWHAEAQKHHHYAFREPPTPVDPDRKAY